MITVGCVNDSATASTADDSLCTFSSRGRTLEGTAKPDVVAPGMHVTSTLAPNSTLAREAPASVVDGQYIHLSGTSMSAPVVSGEVALLLQRTPGLTPDQVKALVTSTAGTYPDRPDAAGEVNVLAALQRAAQGNVPSANAGVIPASDFSSLTRLTTSLGDTVSFASSYWDSSYWDSSYWDSSYWDSSYWDSSYWDAHGDN